MPIFRLARARRRSCLCCRRPRSRTLPSLRGGSQHRSGCAHINIARIARQVRSAHALLAAKGRPMRTPKWRYAVVHGRQQPRSFAERQHPSRSSHERLDPIAHCGRPSKRERVGPTPTRHVYAPTHALIHRGQTGPCTRAAQRLSAALSIRSCRACSDRTPSMGCASVGHRDSGSPINKRERNVRRTLLATPMRLVRNGNELRPYGR